MLNLAISPEERPAFEVTVPGGRAISVLPGAKNAVERIFNSKATLRDLDGLYDICSEILSNNAQGAAFTADDLALWPVDSVLRLYKGYIKFLVEIMNSPN